MHPAEQEMTQALLASLISLPVRAATADQAGRLMYEQGRQLSLSDALIAATVLEGDLVLVTTNACHFALLGEKVSALTDHFAIYFITPARRSSLITTRSSGWSVISGT